MSLRGHALLAVVDPATRKICETALLSLGLGISIARTGVAAVIAARNNPPDLMVIDAQLEDVPGRQAVSWLRGNVGLRARPVVLLAETALETAVVGPPTEMLCKPVSGTALMAVASRLLGHAPPVR